MTVKKGVGFLMEKMQPYEMVVVVVAGAGAVALSFL